MISRCPNCGHELLRPIQWGIKSCTNCRIFFEADLTNRLLSAGWEIRKHPMGFDQFLFRTKLPDNEARFVYRHVGEDGLCHDEFLRIVKSYEDAIA